MRGMRAALLFLVVFPWLAHAQSPNMTVEQKQFITLYTEAARERDEDKYWLLIHPETRSCMTENLTRFVQDNFLHKAKHIENIEEKFVRIEQVEMLDIEAKIKKFYRDKAFLPIEPEYTLSAPIRRTANQCGEVSGLLFAEIPIAFHQGRWFEVLACGKNDLDQFLGKQLNAKAIQHKRTNDAYDAISAQTWKTLKPILTEKKDKDSAINLLQEKENLSRSKAIAIIQKYCEQ